MEPDRGKFPRASYAQYQEFVDSFIWKDMETELNFWLSDIKNRLVTENDVDEIRKFQGRAEAIAELLEFPARIISAYEVALSAEEIANGNRPLFD